MTVFSHFGQSMQVTEKLKQGVSAAIKKGQELDKEHHVRQSRKQYNG